MLNRFTPKALIEAASTNNTTFIREYIAHHQNNPRAIDAEEGSLGWTALIDAS